MELLSDAVARTDKQSAWSEVFALILLFVGTLLFFALISYTPKDVPSWIWFSHISPSNHPAQNFIGPVGSIVAGNFFSYIRGFSLLLVGASFSRFLWGEFFYLPILAVPPIPSGVLLFLS